MNFSIVWIIISAVTAIFMLAAGVLLIVLGFKLLRNSFSRVKTSKKFFINTLTSDTSSKDNSDMFPEEVKKIFDQFPNIFNNFQSNQQNNNQQDNNLKANTQQSSYQKNSNNTTSNNDYRQSQASAYNRQSPEKQSKKKSQYANPKEKQNGLNFNAKVLILTFVWITVSILSVFGAIILFEDYLYSMLRYNAGLSDNTVTIISIVFYMLVLFIMFVLLFIVIKKFHKNLPQYNAQGTVEVKKIVKRKVKTGRRYEWRNFCVLTILLDNYIYTDFDTPQDIYNAVTERDFVKIVYNKLSDNEFLIVSLFR